ncbi:MAG TPA: hypothetical protein VEH48_02355 [Candidatus Nitrosopolaris sp.]|nr:hypothetical protein [Candidatus Nitrosopolaris sp.]
MQLSDKLHTFVPVFDWSWWQIFLLTFFIDWLAIHIILYLEPLGIGKPFGKSKRQHFRSNTYGDIFLPIAVASSIVVARGLNVQDVWYTSRWWNIAVVVFGYMLVIALDVQSDFTLRQSLTASKLWHTLIAFPIMFYLGVITLIPLISVHKPLWAFILAIFGYLGWLFFVIWDFRKPPDFRFAA